MKRFGWVCGALIVGLCLMIYGCGEDGGDDLAAESGDETDVVAGERGPMSRVEVGMLHHAQLVNGMFPFLGAAGQARIFTNMLGQEIRLEHAEVWFGRVHLVPCDGGEEVSLLLNFPDDYTAFADFTAITTTHEVPDQPYCEAVVILGPQGAGQSSRTTSHHFGDVTFNFEGVCSAGGQARIFDLATAEPLMVTLPIMNHEGNGMVATPLVPSATNFVREEDDDQIPDLLFGQTYTLLFQSIDCLTASDSELLEHLSTTLLEDVLRQHLGQIDAFVAF